MDKTTDVISWFEMPAIDLERSKKFYQEIFNITMDRVQMGDDLMAFFPWEAGSGRITGALVQGNNHKPSGDGAVVYFNGNPDLQTILDRVQRAGGEVIVPKTSIGENGNFAFFKDTEGNRVGLHSDK